ncbi:MAG: hypothetical protein K6C10_01515 [Prevotella sp.]|nr:hypothetical protein [Prevotella sp.]
MKYFAKIVIVAFLMLVPTTMMAQENHQRKTNHGQFDPAKFDADLEQFITTEACLTPQEASEFFPVYREMLKKQRMLFEEMRRNHHVDVSNNKACRDAIEKQDKLDIQIKEIQQYYHNKFMKLMPAGKVFKILRAEEKFHRLAFSRAAKRGRGR